jgi:hypothetical protein
MAEQNPTNHWDLLASKLGAKRTHHEEDVRQVGPPSSPPPSAPKPSTRSGHRKAASASSKTAGWDALASEFGLEGAAPAPMPSPPASEAMPSVAPSPVPLPLANETIPSATALPQPPEESRRGSLPPETPEESPNFFDERFDFEEPFDLLEVTESPATATEAVEQPSEPSENRPRKRRRRRRRGRGGEQSEPRQPGASATAEDQTAETEDRDSETDSLEPSSADREDHVAEPGESQERRSRRRRPRRGKKHREPAKGDAADKSEVPSGAPSAESGDSETVEADVFAEDALDMIEDVEGDSARPARLGFRGIPTWGEVIGLLVDKNLESRTKRPGSGAHHGRGNRGGRDNRGNRGGKPRS